MGKTRIGNKVKQRALLNLGAAKENAEAKRGRSKEKRSDCPLVTLGLVLDSSGFPRNSKMFAGNASEPAT
ncbi:MAG: hypothetical protein Q9M09_03765 [Mariprofundaceae bacterium]|nr:hypothetical protein [Mariprofundaceae bacterium]